MTRCRFSVIRVWDPDRHCYHGWYVDLEEPRRYTTVGFGSRDHVLDIVAAEDLSTWRWKDEDELAWSVEHSRLPAVLPADARRAVLLLERGGWPFGADSHRWRLDRSCAPTALPPG